MYRDLRWALCAAIAAFPVGHVRADEPVVAPAPPTVSPETPSGTSLPAPPAPLSPGPVSTSPAVPAPMLAVDLTSPSVLVSGRREVVYERPRVGLLAGGLTLFVVGWTADIGFTYGYGHEPAWTSLIPIAGPFIQLTQTYGLDGPAIDTGSSDADARAQKTLDSANGTIKALAFTGAIICGLAQITGLALTIAGAATKRKVSRHASAAPTFDGARIHF